MILSELQVESIKKRLNAGRISKGFIYDDIVDHICCLVEEKMDRGENFEEALERSFHLLPMSQIRKIETETQKLVNMNKYIIKKTLSYLPEGVFLLFSLSWISDLANGYNTWITWFLFGGTILLTTLLIFRFKILAIFSASICGIISFLIFGQVMIALVNENTNIWQDLLYLFMSLGLIALSLIMPWKYLLKDSW